MFYSTLLFCLIHHRHFMSNEALFKPYTITITKAIFMKVLKNHTPARSHKLINIFQFSNMPQRDGNGIRKKKKIINKIMFFLIFQSKNTNVFVLNLIHCTVWKMKTRDGINYIMIFWKCSSFIIHSFLCFEWIRMVYWLRFNIISV